MGRALGRKLVLEASGDLSGNGNWQPATLEISESDGVKRAKLPNTAETAFFRLRRTSE